ncbi:WRKY DNA-binding transcription factor 70-like [Vigna unguiculata]|uniref:WRKY transcription factor 22 n=1 Tax=Vigna unguiculata TaxID=3917 RepID=A0A4D6NBI3_VIGUN|nr:WRKY DNA-binding transcription factor 70-like [Vigna unguiculata]QCE10124.1 WRKY transcription factor 22 [Vigna unguiculata]
MVNQRSRMEEELVKGRDIANQLLELCVHRSNSHHHHHEDVKGSMLPFIEDLVRKVLCSFTNTLLLLNNDNDVSNEVAVSMTVKDVPPFSKCPNPHHTDEVCKGFFQTKKPRGSYKRKSSAPTWVTNSSILVEDGYVWRKYGQKITTNAKYLRSYYRCTHKHDKGCPAIKQVQRIQEDPPLYQTTYYGHHNCKSFSSSDIVMESASPSASSVFLSFSNTLPTKEQYQLQTSSVSSSMKQEPVEVIQDELIADQSLLASSDYLLLCDYEHDFISIT